MNFIKRGFLSVKARAGKSLLQVFIFTVICVFVLSGLSIQSAAEKSSVLARESLGGEVTLNVNMEKLMEQQRSQSTEGERVRFQPVPIPEESAEELTSYSQVKGYNFLSSTFGTAANFEPIENESTNTTETEEGGPVGGMGGGPMSAADITLQGVMFTDSVQSFLNSESTIVEGRHLTDEDLEKNVTVIEKTLAKDNELAVGDKVTVQSTADEETSLELEIVGIYETASAGTDLGGRNVTAMNPYNLLYVPYTAASALKGADYEGTIDQAVYYMNDPEKIDSFTDEAKEKSSIDFETFKLDANDQTYQQMIGPINNVASFSKNVVYLVTVAGAVILGLIIMMSIRERKYEMGVLLAIGEKKWKLACQFLFEILIVAVLALGVSSFSGQAVAKQFGDQLLSQELTQTEETASNPASFGGGRGGMGMGGPIGMQQSAAEADPIDELQIEVTGKDLGILFGIGLLIAIISALIPALSILRLQPKTILTKQD
ncbi:ABC transporter permease [Peribacillus frigoritolerans]|uniref:ABC transporter permease n=1 Tax=Peribacillus frigoritolerans TaxID=450367 RepID=UPI001059D970|nr:ABC transporter permease [Peribacillus frigoritolerans]TDL78897.1 ABC transporter permease [Peribacillus frigoritolerans]